MYYIIRTYEDGYTRDEFGNFRDLYNQEIIELTNKKDVIEYMKNTTDRCKVISGKDITDEVKPKPKKLTKADKEAQKFFSGLFKPV